MLTHAQSQLCHMVRTNVHLALKVVLLQIVRVRVRSIKDYQKFRFFFFKFLDCGELLLHPILAAPRQEATPLDESLGHRYLDQVDIGG